MNTPQTTEVANIVADIQPLIQSKNFVAIVDAVAPLTPEQVASLLERLSVNHLAIVYRLLPKEKALEVFERLTPKMQSDLIDGLQDSEVSAIFADLDPDDRVWLLDELPAALAPRLLHGLSAKDRELTSGVLGYPKGSVGRRMSPEYVSTHPGHTVAQALERVNHHLADAETVYTLPVLDGSRRVVGVVSLRDLMRSESHLKISELMHQAKTTSAYQSAEEAARRSTNLGLLALPIVDKEGRLVGILTIDDAVRILEHEETEDSARQGGVEPLGRPYFATPIRALVKSRIVWLFVLAIGATLTVQVQSHFEATLEQVTLLALFVPLLIGTGGNTGNQAATTVTRALALGDVQPRDLFKVLLRELGVGFSLGATLGALGGLLTALLYEPRIGIVIGLTLVAVCSLAATVGGVMPMIARALRVDPAVFSNPFISTFVDATGLIVYFLIARAVLQI
ncbi:magnesium transporter [Kocuria sp. TGY1127_2]|uniref:magnesium transporter n=1 Tax=Kocuria sp. TGY1127_2 TaxID=2711328 RepID=UPI0015BDD5E1|nr:magnesium transporter [Kocuria sp. TGY1127_2]